MQTVFKILDQLKDTSSASEKKAILSRNKNNELLKKTLYYAYNPFITFGVRALPDTELLDYCEAQGDISIELFDMLDLFASDNRPTPTQMRGMVKTLMQRCTEEGAVWVGRIVQKDLNIGIADTTINSVFKGLIPTFGVQLALPMAQEVKAKGGIKVVDRWPTLSYPVAIEEKYDGMRVIAICHDGSVRYFSREGHEITTLGHLTQQILALRPGTSFVLDGEVIGIKYNQNCSPAKKAYAAGMHWEFAQALSMTKSGNQGKGTPYSSMEMSTYVGYMVWDIIEHDYFTSEGEEGARLTFKERRIALSGLFLRREENEALKNVILAPSRIANSQAEVVAFTDKVVEGGGEGSMVKRLDSYYQFDRTDDVLKVKSFKSGDFRIVGIKEAEKDTQFEGMVGALLLSDDEGMSAEVGSGLSANDRADLMVMYLRGELVGKIAEVRYFERTPNNSLRIPIYMRLRLDKTSCSWN